MKIYILSDLHLEFGTFEPPQLDADVIVLAGDIHVGYDSLEWAKEYFVDKPVIYVLGNHEYYGSSLQEHLSLLKSLTQDSNIHLLENESIQIDDVQFLGCTLWTDFNLHNKARSAKNMATRYISDYDMIKYGASKRKLKSADIFKQHQRSLRWLSKQLKSAPIGKRVVVTHHSPSQKSLSNDSNYNVMSAAYASNLDDIVSESSADLWIHGHIHAHKDYMIGNTRVICNPRGYIDSPNDHFKSDFVVTI